MSYRNPKQVLDTSTAKLYGDISKSISKGMSSFDQAYKADQQAIKKNQDEIGAMVKQAQDQKVLFDTTLNKAYEGGGAWFDEENKARLSEEANKVSLLMQKSVKTPEEMQRISNFMGAAGTTTKDITQLGALLSNLENDLAKGTGQGGVSGSQDPEKLIRARGFAGLIPGAKIKVETDLSRPGGPVNVYKFIHPETKKEYSIDSKELRTIENTPGANMYDVTPTFDTVINKGVEIAKNAAIYDNKSVTSTMVRDQSGNLVMTQFSKDASKKLFNQVINNNVIETVGAYGPQDYISANNYWVGRVRANPEQYPGEFQKMQPIDNKSNLKDRSQLISVLKRATFIASGDLNKSVGKTLAGDNANLSQGQKDFFEAERRVSEINNFVESAISSRSGAKFNGMKTVDGTIVDAKIINNKLRYKLKTKSSGIINLEQGLVVDLLDNAQRDIFQGNLLTGRYGNDKSSKLAIDMVGDKSFNELDNSLMSNINSQVLGINNPYANADQNTLYNDAVNKDEL
tara:strand:- start:4074 stop:5615 length:1542 start_codon:yes stop_codon:yes gene_type:complete